MIVTDGKMLKKLHVLFALIKGARRGDRELSKILGTPLSSATRIRRELEATGMIQQYTLIPDFRKLGLGINAFTFFSTSGKKSVEHFENLRKSIVSNSCIVYVGLGQGLGSDCLIISLHEDYDGYMGFIKSLKSQPGLCLCSESVQSFLLSTDRSQAVLPFTLGDLERLVLGMNGKAEVVRTSSVSNGSLLARVKVTVG